jgi:hypothetical protein
MTTRQLAGASKVKAVPEGDAGDRDFRHRLACVSMRAWQLWLLRCRGAVHLILLPLVVPAQAGTQ